MSTSIARGEDIASDHPSRWRSRIGRIFSILRAVHFSIFLVPFLLWVFAALFVSFAKMFNSTGAGVFFSSIVFSILMYQASRVLKRGGEIRFSWRVEGLYIVLIVVTVPMVILLLFAAEAIRDAWRVY